MRWIKHLKTITRHRNYTLYCCSQCGLKRRGIVHDFSKFSLEEFIFSAKYYTNGKCSPIKLAKAKNGYSRAWLHHKGRNKHHPEYWIDFDLINGKVIPIEMPKKYVVEMVCDWVSASKTYNGGILEVEKFKNYVVPITASPLVHPKTKQFILKILNVLDNTNDFVCMFKYCKKVLKEAK